MGNPLMNDSQLSQKAGRAKTQQPDRLVKPTEKSAEELPQKQVRVASWALTEVFSKSDRATLDR